MSEAIARTIQVSEHEWERIFHDQLEAHGERVGDYNPANWRTAGRKTKDNPNGNDAAWWYEEGLRQVNAYAEWLASSGWRIHAEGNEPLVEAEVSGVLGGFTVKAYLDAVLRDPDDRLVVTDYKTGSRTPHGVLQLATYRALLLQRFGIDVRYGAFFMTRKGQITDPIDLAKYTPGYIDNLFRQFGNLLETGVYLPSLGDHCVTCDVADACFANGGIDAYKYDPDHPKYNATRQIRSKSNGR